MGDLASLLLFGLWTSYVGFCLGVAWNRERRLRQAEKDLARCDKRILALRAEPHRVPELVDGHPAVRAALRDRDAYLVLMNDAASEESNYAMWLPWVERRLTWGEWLDDLRQWLRGKGVGRG